MHPMPRPRARRVHAFGLLFLAGWWAMGCNTGATPGALPTPDFQAPLNASFPLRAGDVGYVQGQTDYLYISVQSLGADNRCPPESACDEPGFLEVFLELETSESQGALGMRVPPRETPSAPSRASRSGSWGRRRPAGRPASPPPSTSS